MDAFVARQPIFTPNKKIFGYELLFRLGLENVFPDIDGDAATSNLMSNMFFPFDFNEILGDKPGLINFTKKLILQKIPLLLPREHFIIEVLENIEPDENVIAALSLFSSKGFTIALDDFVYHKKFESMMALCKIIKFDVIATPLDTLYKIIKQVRSSHDVLLLAEKVETYGEFEQAVEMGFDLFQGYFFSRPEILSTKGISATQAIKIKLINEVSRKEMIPENVEELIKNDVAVSFKLLKFINSAYFNRRIPVNTIKEAITYLGVDELKKFISIIVISDLGAQKPDELVRISIIRARMCEKCGAVFNTCFTKDELFILGLFSLMDAILDCSMKDILEHIVLSDKIKTALLGKNKDFNIILSIVKGFEQGKWKHKIFAALSKKPVEQKLPGFYLDAVKMANSFV